MMDHVETYDLNSNVWTINNGYWYRNDGKCNREEISQLGQDVDEQRLLKKPMLSDVSYPLVNGYFIRIDTLQPSAQGEGRQYTQINVQKGEIYIVSGYALNANVPCVFIDYGARRVALLEGTNESFSKNTIVVQGNGTLYINGLEGSQEIHLKKVLDYETDMSVYEDIDKAKSNISSLEERVNNIEKEIPEIDIKLDRKIQYSPIPVTLVNNHYMRNDMAESAEVSDGRQYTQISVSEGDVLVISGFGIAACNAVLLKKSNNAVVALLEIGAFVNEKITIPASGTLYVNGNTTYREVEIKKEDGRQTSDEFYQELDNNISEAKEQKVYGLQHFIFNNNVLKIASKFQGDEDSDLVQIWQNTLQYPYNTIFSFYLVKKVENSSPIPIANIGNNDGFTIMAQSSDCILATRFNRYNDYHGTAEADVQYTSGNHTLSYNGHTYKTAETKNVEIFADGVPITQGKDGYAKTIDIIVTTDAYDPFVLYDSVVADADSPEYVTLFTERMVYRVVDGSIRCTASRTFKKDGYMETYGGFASMAEPLTYGYFPMGAPMRVEDTDKFGELTYNIGVYDGIGLCDKEDYPNFNHFIRRNSDASIFESVFMTDYASGVHSEIPNDYSMYWAIYYSTWEKVYHRVTYQKSFAPGDIQRLECVYNWFVPVANTGSYIVYSANNYLIIDIKSAFKGVIPIPQNAVRKEFSVVQKTVGVEIGDELNADGIDVVSTSSGSIILMIK